MKINIKRPGMAAFLKIRYTYLVGGLLKGGVKQ